jgi:hypothetical protein
VPIAVAGTITATVQVRVPPEAPAASHTLLLEVVAEDDTESVTGQSVSFSVPARVTPRKFPWWILIVAAVVLALIIGLVIFFISRGGHHEPPVPAPSTPTAGPIPTRRRSPSLPSRPGQLPTAPTGRNRLPIATPRPTKPPPKPNGRPTRSLRPLSLPTVTPTLFRQTLSENNTRFVVPKPSRRRALVRCACPEVTAQSIEPGQQIARGTAILLTVSTFNPRVDGELPYDR